MYEIRRKLNHRNQVVLEDEGEKILIPKMKTVKK